MKKILATALRLGKATIIPFILAGIFLGGCSANQSVQSGGPSSMRNNFQNQSSVSVQSPGYIFQVGDQLRITIRGYSEIDTTIVIGESGMITMRLIGEVKAAGITRSQLVDDLTNKLEKYVKTEVRPSVDVLNAGTQKVIVLGSVQRQDNYTITADVTIFQILAMAGGPIPEADLQHVKIFRYDNVQKIQEVDLIKCMEKGNLKDLPLVKSGDMVYVPREENLIRELSNFFRDTIFLFTLFSISN